MLRQTQLCKDQTLSTLLEYRRQLLNDLYSLEIYLRDKFYWLLQTGLDAEHKIHLDTIYASKTEYPDTLGEEVVLAVYNALNVPPERVLEAYNNALLQSKHSTSIALLKYHEFQEMERLKTAYDTTFVAEEMLRMPKVSMVKYKIPNREVCFRE